MAIHQVTENTKFTPGQWVLDHPRVQYTICGAPKRVVKQSGQRVYVTDVFGNEGGDYLSPSSLLFVCDTREEADMVHLVSSENSRTVMEKIRTTAAASLAQIMSMCAAPAAAEA